MKRIISLVCIILLFLTGCGIEDFDNKEIVYADNFICMERYEHSLIYVDKNTKVMYWKYSASGSDTGLTVILNADGSPMLWEGDLE